MISQYIVGDNKRSSVKNKLNFCNTDKCLIKGNYSEKLHYKHNSMYTKINIKNV